MRKKGTPLIRAQKTEYKGKKFQSRLEVYMYKLLDDNGVKCKYEEEKFEKLGAVSRMVSAAVWAAL